MKLKAIKPVNNCLNKFMREWGLTAEIGTDFAYVFTSNIYYNLSEAKRVHRNDS